MKEVSAVITKMSPRDPAEPHRTSTPLELFYDLVFVVAIAFAAAALHHDVAADHIGHGVVSYLVVFFAIWWAWIYFSWFASAYDNDDILYRITMFVQMVGALIVAAGIPRAFDERDFRVVVIGYVVIRLAHVAALVRAIRANPPHRQTVVRYAVGVSLVQIGWIVWVLIDASLWWFVPLGLIEMLVPIVAEIAGLTPYHSEHMIERYGLFTIIVLGESVLAASVAIQEVVDLDDINWEIAAVIIGGILTLFSIWWIYFGFRDEDGPTTIARSFVWGYGHYVVWAAIAAVGVGISVSIDEATDHAEITQYMANVALALPVAIFLIAMWLVHDLQTVDHPAQRWISVSTAGLVLVATIVPGAPLLIGIILVGYVAVRTWLHGYRTI